MAVFDGSIATAMRLIAKYGKTTELVLLNAPVVDDTADPDKPWNPGLVDQDARVTMQAPGVWLNYEKRLIDGENIRVDDRQVLVAAGALDQELCADVNPGTWGVREVTLDETWAIVNADLLAPNDQQVLLTLQVRR